MHISVLGFFFFAASAATAADDAFAAAAGGGASAFGEMRMTLRVTIVIIISN